MFCNSMKTLDNGISIHFFYIFKGVVGWLIKIICHNNNNNNIMSDVYWTIVVSANVMVKYTSHFIYIE